MNIKGGRIFTLIVVAQIIFCFGQDKGSPVPRNATATGIGDYYNFPILGKYRIFHSKRSQPPDLQIMEIGLKNVSDALLKTTSNADSVQIRGFVVTSDGTRLPINSGVAYRLENTFQKLQFCTESTNEIRFCFDGEANSPARMLKIAGKSIFIDLEGGIERFIGRSKAGHGVIHLIKLGDE
ncbi:MAG: hypothetical protein IPM59_11830 [Chloracidobacterium sp.]|nr:hypothetical protein [Chloracidobacterium sp.]